MTTTDVGATTTWSRVKVHVFGEFLGLVLLGSLVGIIYGLCQSSNRWSVAVNALTVALASAAVGGLLGLLFGVPRYLAQAGAANGGAGPVSPSGSPAPPNPSSSHYLPNTNLEQVSDWLTKLLLGAGLTQIVRLPPALGNLGRYLAPGLGGVSSETFAVALVVFNVLAGFFFGYLAARLELGKAFMKADALAGLQVQLKSELDDKSPAPVDAPATLVVDQTNDPTQRRQALELSRQVVQVESGTAGATFTADEYRRLARELVRVKEYVPAIQQLDAAMLVHPQDPTLPLYAGVIYGMYLNNYDKAEQCYFNALHIQPGLAIANYDLACNYGRRYSAIKAENPERAQAYLEQAKALLELVRQDDPPLLARSIDDPLWDDLGIRDDPHLAGVLPQKPADPALPDDNQVPAEDPAADQGDANQ